MRNGSPPPRRSLAAVYAAVAIAVAACGSATGPLEMPDNSKRDRAPGVEAVLMQLNGSAGQGTIRFVDRGDGRVTMIGTLNNLLPGVYRLALHERGNCSSTNGFSAGRPWVPPGFPRPAGDLIPEIAIGSSSNAVLSATLRGLKLAGPEGLQGRSVVIHAGQRVEDNVVPGVPNNLVLCGVNGPVRSFFDNFRD